MGILYSPHIMSPPSNLHWFLPCVLHLSNVPLSKLHVFFKLFLHLPFLPLFNLHFAFPFFLQLSCVPLSDSHFPIPLFLHCFSIFQDVNILDPRTSASRQHKIIVSFFPQMRTEGFLFYFGGLNRSQPPRTSEVRAIW